MKQTALALMLAVASITAMAQSVSVERHELGSGQPGVVGSESAQQWSNDIFHAPQYMAGYPTAATLWPRVVDVDCVTTDKGLHCKGYNWLPELGRGEYLMIRPVVTVAQKPEVITNTLVVPGPTVYIEVPVKKTKE